MIFGGSEAVPRVPRVSRTETPSSFQMWKIVFLLEKIVFSLEEGLDMPSDVDIC